MLHQVNWATPRAKGQWSRALLGGTTTDAADASREEVATAGTIAMGGLRVAQKRPPDHATPEVDAAAPSCPVPSRPVGVSGTIRKQTLREKTGL